MLVHYCTIGQLSEVAISAIIIVQIKLEVVLMKREDAALLLISGLAIMFMGTVLVYWFGDLNSAQFRIWKLLPIVMIAGGYIGLWRAKT